MTLMVERMARAMIEADAKEYGTDADDIAVSCWHDYIRSALAALREMREPTEVMAGAARAAPMPMVYVDSISGRLDLAFKTNLRAAIDAEIAAYERQK